MAKYIILAENACGTLRDYNNHPQEINELTMRGFTGDTDWIDKGAFIIDTESSIAIHLDIIDKRHEKALLREIEGTGIRLINNMAGILPKKG